MNLVRFFRNILLCSVGILTATEPATLSLFVHGLGANKHQAHDYSCVHEYGFLTDPFSFDFADASLWNHRQSVLAQDRDIQQLEEFLTEYSAFPVVVMGLSRGAATIINYCGSHSPANIKALILESPFDHIRSIVKTILQPAFLHVIPGSITVGMKLATWLYPNYKQDGIHPIDVVDKIPQDMPVMIICSKKDLLIDATSSIRLYKKLLESGHTNVYLLVTAYGQHSNIIWSKSGPEYRKLIGAFLRKYDTATASEVDEELLARYKPSLEDIKKQYNV